MKNKPILTQEGIDHMFKSNSYIQDFRQKRITQPKMNRNSIKLHTQDGLAPNANEKPQPSKYFPIVTDYLNNKKQRIDRKFTEFCYQKVKKHCKEEQLRRRDITKDQTDMKYEEVRDYETLNEAHEKQIELLKNENQPEKKERSPSSPRHYLRGFMDSRCKIYPRVDISQENAMAEIQQIYNQNKDYIQTKFEKEGMFDNFKEYMSRNCWREENGDMLNFTDFM